MIKPQKAYLNIY